MYKKKYKYMTLELYSLKVTSLFSTLDYFINIDIITVNLIGITSEWYSNWRIKEKNLSCRNTNSNHKRVIVNDPLIKMAIVFS